MPLVLGRNYGWIIVRRDAPLSFICEIPLEEAYKIYTAKRTFGK